ncbi:MAG TPA: amino acid ABC transporter permease [Metalysinibacillus jejuensis]|uniref:Amino acid ABC transporter permease n=1 Tax=Metalysinibacillus jejuensis TaxID=914327 RepID=A0A921T5N4_9BACL|nr:amino acid ABC transporter permease [Metalysinibacillus jejuensis]HJH11778.1 amino acid ABC transporter permease [Metalysinibacillus jejuensis]
MDIAFFKQALGIAFSGVPLTLLVTVVTLIIALPVGFFLTLVRMKRIPVIHQLIGIYLSFIRGTPVIIQIFVLYNSIPLLIAGVAKGKFDVYAIHPIWYAFVIFSFGMAAIVAEIVRGALQTVDKGQLEAAYSVGLTVPQAYRRIILPQMLTAALPNLCTATVNLVKATSLGYAIALPEITLRTKVAANAGYHYVEAYTAIFIVYLLICLLIEYAFHKTEQRVRRYQGGIAC